MKYMTKENLFISQYKKKELQKELKKIINVVIPKYRPEKIILFGSLAHNHIRETSDIDIFIIKDTYKRYWDRIDEVLHLVHPEEAIDIFIFTPKEVKDNLRKKNPYLKEILEEGKVLYERTS